jgi:hypothetical protein
MRGTALVTATLLVAGGLAAGLLTAGPAALVAARPQETAERVGALGPTPSARSLVGTMIDSTLFSTHVVDIQNPAVWPDIVLGAIRLWDTSTSWADIEKSPGAYNWAALDQAIAVAQGFGKKDIMLVLGGTPAWASDDPSPNALPYPGAAGMPLNPSRWDEWVTQVATRYKGRITSYQVWNEANLSTFSTMTPAEMADLTKRAYDIIKSIDPQALVVAPSTGTRLTSAFTKFYPAFLAELKARGWPVDVFTAHTYPSSLGTPTDRVALIRQWIQALRKAGAPDRPLWDTEVNYGLAGPGAANPHQDITGAQAASWTARTYLDSLRLGISRAYWYAWAPENALLGIQMYKGTPAAQAENVLLNSIISTWFNGCIQKVALVSCAFTKPAVGKEYWVWSEGMQQQITVPPGITHLCRLDGTCVKLTTSQVMVRNPVLLRPKLPWEPA